MWKGEIKAKFRDWKKYKADVSLCANRIRDMQIKPCFQKPWKNYQVELPWNSRAWKHDKENPTRREWADKEKDEKASHSQINYWTFKEYWEVVLEAGLAAEENIKGNHHHLLLRKWKWTDQRARDTSSNWKHDFWGHPFRVHDLRRYQMENSFFTPGKRRI